MSRGRTLRFPRPWLLALTLGDMALVSFSALGIQDGRPLLAAPSWLALALAAAFLLLLSREWFSPSRIDIGPDSVAVKWNNWRVRGARLGAELTPSRPRILRLVVGEPVFSVDPVGPLHLAAMHLARPLLSPLLPPHLARLYFIDSRKLSELVGGPDGPAVVDFPAYLLGKRRIRNVLAQKAG